MSITTDADRDLGSFLQGVKDEVKDSLKQHLAIDIDGIKQAGKECFAAARETSTICTTTASKATQLVAFGVEMKTALDGFNDGIDANAFAGLGTILSGDKMRPALSLAGEMDDLAITCAEQSVKMIDTIDTGIETLPDVLEKNLDKRMDKAKENGSKDGDPEVPNMEDNVRSLEDAATGVSSSNPLNAAGAFQNAFDGISTKGELCKTIFMYMRDFAEDVAGVSEAIGKFKIGKMVGHVRDLVKDIWRCLRLSDLIRSFANAVAKLIKSIMKVINALIEKIQSVDIEGLLSDNCGGCCAQLESNFGMKTGDLKKMSTQLLNALCSGSGGGGGGGTNAGVTPAY